MNLYLISQDVNDNYDTYDSAVVCAENKTVAKGIHPSGEQRRWGNKEALNSTWVEAKRDKVKIKLIGVAAEGLKEGVVLASFNAG